MSVDDEVSAYPIGFDAMADDPASAVIAPRWRRGDPGIVVTKFPVADARRLLRNPATEAALLRSARQIGDATGVALAH